MGDITIPRNVLHIAGVAHSERTRYAMNNIRVACGEAGEHTAEATDGKAIVRLTWKGAPDTPTEALIPREAAEAALKASKRRKDDPPATIRYTGAELATTTKDGAPAAFPCPQVDSHYPPTDDCIERETRRTDLRSIVVNAGMLMNMLDAMTKAGGTQSVALDVSDDPRRPLRVRLYGADGLTSGVGLLMPLATNADDPRMLPVRPLAPDCAEVSE
jgi:hypothetical protein